MTDDADLRPWVPVPLARGTRGAVVAPHHMATEAGLHILRSGGSAVDAAIATNAVLSVVQPGSCGLGGDAFWLIWDEATGRQTALNGSGRSAAVADPAVLRTRGLTTIPKLGGLSITVPGAVRSWADAHRGHGRLSRAEVLGPAIELARDGFAVSDGMSQTLEQAARVIGADVGRDADFFEVFRPHGRAWRPGERLRQPALATTLETMAREGFDAFYEGDLADRLARALAAVGSPITAADLADHASTASDPIAIDYRGTRVTTHPPNSSGMVALEILGILRAMEPPRAAFGPDGVTDPAWIHAGLEAAKLAIADRDAHLTDPEARDVPVAELLDDERLARLAARIDLRQAAPPPAGTNPPGGGTIYLAVVDREGNAVSLIQSLYFTVFGSGIVDPATGVLFQNRGSYFSLDPHHPNVLAPRKRTLHTLLPGMLLRDAGDGRGHRPWIVVGGMGGDAQPQVHAQFVSAVVDGGADIRTAVAAPRWFIDSADHFEPPTIVRLEPRHRPEIAPALVALGHDVRLAKPFDGADLGRQHAIELVDGGPAAPDGSLAATTDPRSEGLPAVW